MHVQTNLFQEPDFEDFLRRHTLGDDYWQGTQTWFVPLADRFCQGLVDHDRTEVVAIHGCQGSGKSTLADFLRVYGAHQYGLKVVCLSLDDFYLTREERMELGEQVHPLLATRGVPGTHDVFLANQVLDALTERSKEVVNIPRFDKSRDDRFPVAQWDCVDTPVDLVIFEGWCMGVTPQPSEPLMTPVNQLEVEEDPDGRWRKYVNDALATIYPSLFARMNQWVMLQAPSFDCVYQWRLEQEQKMAARLSADSQTRVMSAAQVLRFIQHYQRLTEHAFINLPERVQHLLTLDHERHVIAYSQPLSTNG